MTRPDVSAVAIIGAGHAGQAAADLARDLGLEATILDDRQDHGALVWLIENDTICFSRDDVAHKLTAQRIILAPGALDRPMPGVDNPSGSDEIPNIQITSALGLEHCWDPVQRFWYARCGTHGETAQEHIFLAGAVTGRFGPALAAWQGRTAACAVARSLGAHGGDCDPGEPPPAETQSPSFLDAKELAGDIVVCDCEGTTVDDIRRLADLGCRDVNQAKALGRPGTGSCQGRRCALAVAEVLAHGLGVDMAEVGYFRQRWPTSPVSLEQLSKFANEDN